MNTKMNHKQFRPGNLVNVSGKPETITGVLPFGMYFHLMYCPFNLSKIEPIPITKEWLVKFGFERGTDMGDERKEFYIQEVDERGFILNQFYVWLFGSVFKIELLWEGYESELNIEIKSVHQLQNLYFALTGEELTTKPELISND